MTSFERRILDGGGSDQARALLQEARSYRPPQRMRRRLLLGLGLGAGVATKAAGAGALAAWSKVVILVAVGGAVASGAHYAAVKVLSSRKDVTLHTIPQAAVVSSAAGAETTGSAVASPAGADGVPPDQREVSSSSAPHVPAPNLSRLVGSVRAPSVADELAELDEARRDLHAGRPAEAIAKATHYLAAYPKGAMRPEAEVLRIESMSALGDHSKARSLAHEFLTAHPTSILARRARILAEQNGEGAVE